MHLNDIDLKLLRVFHAVVEARGFSNAQNTLNISPSTISNHMNQLEGRLGFSLCERGRSGFRLTAKGEQFHRHVMEFFSAVYDLETSAHELRQNIAGHLNLGIIDNLATDSHCPLHRALDRFFRQRQYNIDVSLEVLSPQGIERELLDGRLEAGLGIFYRTTAGLHYRPLYRERDVLVCARHHFLGSVTDPHELASAIPTARKIARNFMQKQEFPFIQEDDESIITTVTNVEAAAFLILNGPFIGFLPWHYARRWLDTGELVALMPDKFVRYSRVSLVTREQPSAMSRVLDYFLECFETEHANTDCEPQLPPFGASPHFIPESVR